MESHGHSTLRTGGCAVGEVVGLRTSSSQIGGAHGQGDYTTLAERQGNSKHKHNGRWATHRAPTLKKQVTTGVGRPACTRPAPGSFASRAQRAERPQGPPAPRLLLRGRAPANDTIFQRQTN